METQTHSFATTFILRPSKKDEEQSIVYLRLSLNNDRVEISTKEQVITDNWDKKKECLYGRDNETQKLNIIFQRKKENAIAIYHDYVFKKKPFSVYDVKNTLLGLELKSYSLMDAFDFHMEHAKLKLAPGTCKNFLATQRIFKTFIKTSYKKGDVLLCELSFKFLKDFEFFIYKRNEVTERTICHNSITKHIVRLRKIIRMAVENEWMVKDPFSAYRVSYHKTHRKYLTQDELIAIEEKHFRIRRLDKIKDLFLFSCYTGLAYIDAQNLTKDNLSFGIDGELWIKTKRAKTDAEVSVPLLPTAKKIIMKYQEDAVVKQTGKLLPSITNIKLNAYLKEVAELCGINQNLTSHMARHTFATTVTLTNGVPIESVSKMLGHANIRATQLYAKVIDAKVSQDMKNLKSLLIERNNKASGF